MLHVQFPKLTLQARTPQTTEYIKTCHIAGGERCSFFHQPVSIIIIVHLYNHKPTISEVESHPYLGITIDSKLSWSKHVHTTTSQCARTLGLLKCTLHPATPKVKETAYNMLIRPKLEYATLAWNPHKQNNIDTLEKIQRSAATFTLNDHTCKTSTTELINKLGWET